ncbi:MAG TPA: hypothetical protein VKT77_06320 [Chthonomonadaceae bacterium]|nr:hypothetical protein [Chthonomonadaceae bacterium]
MRSRFLIGRPAAHGALCRAAGICAAVLLLCAGGARAGQPPAGKNPEPPKSSRYGDIEVRGYQRLTAPFNSNTLEFTGPNTIVEAPDKASGARFIVHADSIRLIEPLSATKSVIELRGGVRYTITQTTPLGERRVTGTAGSADYRRAARKVLLAGGVRAELLDPRLDGPGALRASTVTIDISAGPYVYSLSGDSATNDLRFSPKPAAKPGTAAQPGRAAPQNPGAQLGAVHITRWVTGIFQAGKSAKFDGEEVVADLKSRAGTPEGQLRAPHVEGDFTPEGGIAHARAERGVHYHFLRPIARQSVGKAGTTAGQPETGREEVTGTCRDATYDPAEGRTTLDGEIDATLVNTLTLIGPGKLLAERVVMTEPPAGDKTTVTRFEISGAPNHRRLAFTPKPAPARPGGSAPAVTAPAAADNAGDQDRAKRGPVAAVPAPFTIGSIVLLGFDKGVYEPGKRIEVQSDGTTPLFLDTADSKTRSAAHVETRQFKASLAETGEIVAAETGGGVTFRIQQPAPSPEPDQASPSAALSAAKAPEPALQQLDGTAAKATYTAGDKARVLALLGPLNAKLLDPRVKETTTVGKEGDTYSMDLVSRVMVWDTPKNTMVIDVKPLDRPIPEKPASGAGKRKGKK